MEQKILLADKMPFAEGATRRVYAHPQDPRKCLKIERADSKAEKMEQRKLRRLRPASLGQNIRDGQAYLYLEMLNFPAAYLHIPRFTDFAAPTWAGRYALI